MSQELLLVILLMVVGVAVGVVVVMMGIRLAMAAAALALSVGLLLGVGLSLYVVLSEEPPDVSRLLLRAEAWVHWIRDQVSGDLEEAMPERGITGKSP